MKQHTDESARKSQLLDQFQSSADSFFHKLRIEAEQIIKEEALTEGQLYLLFTLDEKGTCKASDITNSLGVTSGAVTAMCDKLVKMDLIRRERTDEDRRMVLLSLTDGGKKLVTSFRTKSYRALLTRLGKLDVAELETIVQVFNRLSDIMASENTK